MVVAPQPQQPPLTYKFVKGTGDANHEARLHQAAEQGYKATLMIFDEVTARVNNQGVIVLMEKQK